MVVLWGENPFKIITLCGGVCGGGGGIVWLDLHQLLR